ncbi:hypothetical protein CFN60_19320 [Bacillus velezensis]|nr:hypothetical protein CFN60_19320 [Bacillus velezensis]ATV24783.1 hypothetical protein CS547_19395 [Bacillus sp. Lzh-5]MVZ94184.1 hypothetical protein [Bacillus velezensis]
MWKKRRKLLFEGEVLNEGFFLGLGKPLAFRNMRRKVWLEENPSPLKESEGKIRLRQTEK